jgi:hypothetical protein
VVEVRAYPMRVMQNCSFWVCRCDDLFKNAGQAQNIQAFPVAACSSPMFRTKRVSHISERNPMIAGAAQII